MIATQLNIDQVPAGLIQVNLGNRYITRPTGEGNFVEISGELRLVIDLNLIRREMASGALMNQNEKCRRL